MKRIIFLSIIAFGFLSSNAQRLTLTDLTNLCNKQNWEDVNQILLSKNWTYYDSEKGSTLKYNTITWSFNKEEYSDKANAWFNLYTFEDFPNKIVYSVFNKESYSLLQNSLSANGFKLSNSEIEDNQVISTYSNQSYTLRISTAKREDSDFSSRSITSYSITLIKKAGVYDPDNGNKTDYFDNGYSPKAEYNLKNGELHGLLKAYYQNGNVRKEGYYTNGKESGLFKEYNEDGTKNFEYSMKDGELNGAFKAYYGNGQVKKLGEFLNGKENGNFKEYNENGELEITYTKVNDKYNGLLIIYENGKISKKINYLNGIKDGLYSELSYGKNDTLLLEYIGVLKNELKDGIWNLYLFKDGKKEVVEFTSYKNDIKEGAFKKVQGDSLIYGNYANAKLDGNYIVYIDLMRSLFGGIISTDSTGLNIQSKGKYYQGNRTGSWTFYSFGKKVREGHYWNDFKDGEWNYYYPNYVDEKGKSIYYSGSLYLTENYKSDKLNGRSLRYSMINEEKILCDTTLNKRVNPLDTCTKSTYVKVFESSYFKDDLLHGPYIYKDSIDNIRLQGNFINGKKNGAWLVSYVNSGIKDEKYIVYQEGNFTNDKKEGKWIEYVTKDYIWNESNYSDGKLNGKYFEFNKNKTLRTLKTFDFDKLKTLAVYDSLGTSVIRKYEILEESDAFLKVRKTDIDNDMTQSYDYWIKNERDMSNHNFFELMFDVKTSDILKGVHSYLDGEVKITDKNQQIMTNGHMFKENKIGIWEYNYQAQNVQIQLEYIDNNPGIEKYFTIDSKQLFSGNFVFTDSANNFKEERKIKNGLRNGTTQFYDLNGVEIKKEKYKDGILK